ncbi:acetolactate synthase large subunit [Xenorhabdus anantnagensis]|uniref:Acetolactate synthase large subunit n=1 Tax=Xenorhabdus anantnagensis TaxID=3025875 RepID=A0ABT5LUG0_9GAMM|nr:acetolactate synthase large subunit [Xenorhabdus anantnagensis]MDC9596660.1 acetolactate synthase large subunit [Xenorhabdus anantnagensis]
MNGAESLLRSLIASGVTVCFGNPGTSEMHFVSALDSVSEMRCILGLHENVVTGAADGYARMAEKPACTLLHLGPGLSNGLANLHNARRASSAIVNIVGDHALSHAGIDAPLASDIIGIARPVSDWVYTSISARNVGADAARAVQAANRAPGSIATLILPADTAWNDADDIANPLPFASPIDVSHHTIERVAAQLRHASSPAILLRGNVLKDEGLIFAGRIAKHTGARLLCDTFAPRLQRGAGRVVVERLPYFAEQVLESLRGIDLLVLVGAKPPVSFFAYPEKSGWLTPEGCMLSVLSHSHENGCSALSALVEALGAGKDSFSVARLSLPEFSRSGALDARAVMQAVARHMPENAILADESVSSGFAHYGITASSVPHDYLNLTGGAIGSMMAVSIGAAVVCPDRKIITLVGDGSAMYTLQSLWTQAREKLNVTTVILANRGYKVLHNELIRVGAAQKGIKAHSMIELTDPQIDWVSLAHGMGIEAVRVELHAGFEDAFLSAMRHQGPRLIEAVIN